MDAGLPKLPGTKELVLLGFACDLAESVVDLQALLGHRRQLQAVSRDSDASKHGEGGDKWTSAKDFGQACHGSDLIQVAPAEAGAVARASN